MIVEIYEHSEGIIEVVEKGPQGADGQDGEVMTDAEVKVAYENNANTNAFTDADKSKLDTLASETLFIVDSTIGQAIPQHDGTVNTEVTLNLGTGSNDDIVVTDGLVLFLNEVKEIHALIELQTLKASGGVALMGVWAEMSVDGGSTWTLVPDSLRFNAVNTDSEGINTYDLSTKTVFPAGVMLRITTTNGGGGNLSIAVPSFVSSLGTISGKSAKATISYQ